MFGVGKPRKKMKLMTLDSFVKVRKKQVFYWQKLGKVNTLKVMQYLSLTEMCKLGTVCHYFHLCYREMWDNYDFFQDMDLTKFSSVIECLTFSLK